MNRPQTHLSQVIAVSNQKGGVGKTTTVVNIASFCALAGLKTLVIDNDPQANASSVLAHDAQIQNSVYGGTAPITTSQDDLWIIPAGADLIDQERELTRSAAGRFVLKQIVQPLRERFDVIFIDCPPNLTLLPTNALLAADYLLAPVQSEYFALEGLTQLLRYVEELRHDVNASIQLLGILLTMYDASHPLARQIEAEIRLHFTSRVFTAVIPRDVALAAAPSHGRTIMDHDPLSVGGIAYLAATQELMHGLKR